MFDIELGHRLSDGYDKKSVRERYKKSLKYYTDFIVNVRKSAFFNRFPHQLYLRTLSSCQRACLNKLFSVVRDIKKGKPPSVTIIDSKAGTGKTSVIHAFCTMLIQENIDFQIACYTAAAASNYDCPTIHSLLSIYSYHVPYHEMTTLPITPRLRSRFNKCSLLILDEFSLISASCLWMILQRIKLVKNTTESIPIYLILVGDQMQIPPVFPYALWAEPLQSHDDYTKNGISLFSNPDHYITLNEVVRQSGDKEFANVLSNIHSKTVSHPDCSLLESRRNINLSDSELKLFENSVHLFSTNSSCFYHNINYIRKNITSVVRIDPELTPNCNLCRETIFPLFLYNGCSVILSKNLIVQKKLFNGSRGKVLGLYYLNDNDLIPCFISCKFFDYTGTTLKEDEGGVPIKPSIEKQYCAHLDQYIKVKKYDLIPGSGLTFHRSQGLTLDSAVVDLTGLKFYDPRIYVSFSRVRSRSNLVIVSNRPVHKYLIKDEY